MEDHLASWLVKHEDSSCNEGRTPVKEDQGIEPGPVLSLGADISTLVERAHHANLFFILQLLIPFVKDSCENKRANVDHSKHQDSISFCLNG